MARSILHLVILGSLPSDDTPETIQRRGKPGSQTPLHNSPRVVLVQRKMRSRSQTPGNKIAKQILEVNIRTNTKIIDSIYDIVSCKLPLLRSAFHDCV